MPDTIVYSSEADEHLNGLTARQHATVLHAVDAQLRHQPTIQARNRKEMRENPLAEWELRVGDIRVYYEVNEEPEPTVRIRAIGLKLRNRVYIAGEEVEL